MPCGQQRVPDLPLGLHYRRRTGLLGGAEEGAQTLHGSVPTWPSRGNKRPTKSTTRTPGRCGSACPTEARISEPEEGAPTIASWAELIKGLGGENAVEATPEHTA